MTATPEKKCSANDCAGSGRNSAHPTSTIQRHSRLAFSPLVSAIAAIDAPSRRQAATHLTLEVDAMPTPAATGQSRGINVV